MSAKIHLSGSYARTAAYLYPQFTNTFPFRLKLCKRDTPQPYQPREYLVMYPQDAACLPDGRKCLHVSGLYLKQPNTYKIEWQGTYYRVTLSADTAQISVWNKPQSTDIQAL